MNSTGQYHDDVLQRSVLTASQRRKHSRSRETFLSGAYSWAWLEQAEQAGALFVALHLLKLAKMRGTDRVQFSATNTASELNMSRSTLYRKLQALEEAGLILVLRKPRRWPIAELQGSPRILVKPPKNATVTESNSDDGEKYCSGLATEKGVQLELAL